MACGCVTAVSAPPVCGLPLLSPLCVSSEDTCPRVWGRLGNPRSHLQVLTNVLTSANTLCPPTATCGTRGWRREHLLQGQHPAHAARHPTPAHSAEGGPGRWLDSPRRALPPAPQLSAPFAARPPESVTAGHACVPRHFPGAASFLEGPGGDTGAFSPLGFPFAGDAGGAAASGQSLI